MIRSPSFSRSSSSTTMTISPAADRLDRRLDRIELAHALHGPRRRKAARQVADPPRSVERETTAIPRAAWLALAAGLDAAQGREVHGGHGHRRQGGGGAAARERGERRPPRSPARYGEPPRLCVLIVGDNPASRAYVRTKTKMAAEAGLDGELIELPDDDLDRRAAGADRRAQPRSAYPRHPGPAAAAAADRRARPSCRRIAPGQGRRRLPSAQCRPAVLRRPRAARRPAGPLHALWQPASAARDAWAPAAWPAGRRSSSAAPTSSASRWRPCCWARTARSPSPIRAPATCPRSAAAPTFWSRPSAGRRSSAATGSSRAPR